MGPNRYAHLARLYGWLLLGLSGVASCHPGNEEAKRLHRACEAGDAVACNGLGQKLLKGEYVLRDEKRGAALLETACEGNVAAGCARLGALRLDGDGVKIDSAIALGLL
jgi:TPR repeat protein